MLVIVRRRLVIARRTDVGMPRLGPMIVELTMHGCNSMPVRMDMLRENRGAGGTRHVKGILRFSYIVILIVIMQGVRLVMSSQRVLVRSLTMLIVVALFQIVAMAVAAGAKLFAATRSQSILRSR